MRRSRFPFFKKREQEVAQAGPAEAKPGSAENWKGKTAHPDQQVASRGGESHAGGGQGQATGARGALGGGGGDYSSPSPSYAPGGDAPFQVASADSSGGGVPNVVTIHVYVR